MSVTDRTCRTFANVVASRFSGHLLKTSEQFDEGFGLEGADRKPIRCTRISTDDLVLKEVDSELQPRSNSRPQDALISVFTSSPVVNRVYCLIVMPRCLQNVLIQNKLLGICPA
jgi:hypothetical protein